MGLTLAVASLKSPKCNPAYPGTNRHAPSCSTRITLCCLSSLPHILSILPLAAGCRRNKRVLGACCESHMFGSNFFQSSWLHPSQSGYYYRLYRSVCGQPPYQTEKLIRNTKNPQQKQKKNPNTYQNQQTNILRTQLRATKIKVTKYYPLA